MGLIGLIMACYGGLWGILTRLTKSTDDPNMVSILGIVLVVLGMYSAKGVLGPLGRGLIGVPSVGETLETHFGPTWGTLGTHTGLGEVSQLEGSCVLSFP